MPNTVPDYLHVAAAVIRGVDNRILLAQRPPDKHQGGKWEFPGGKVEAGETPLQALGRELLEELGIRVQTATPLIKVRHVYPERAVLLDVWEVTAFNGEPHGCEGQPVAWFRADALRQLEFPPANYPIITAACLPDQCLVTPEPSQFSSASHFLGQLEQVLDTGVRLVQFRAKSLSSGAYLKLVGDVIRLTHAKGAQVILNSPPVLIAEADGLHLTSSQLMGGHAHREQRLPRGKLLSASCHSPQELQQAAALGVDFVFLAPVLPTRSHPDAASLGWEAFQRCVDACNFPVYALGGMRRCDVPAARECGAQGIAAISSLWDSSS